MMRYPKLVHATLAASCVAFTSPPTARAQASTQTVTTAASDPDIDTKAIDALAKMGDYLRTLKTFQVKATVTDEDVLANGQKITSTKVADLIAVRPNKLRMTVTNDRKERLFVYDGTTFTMYAPLTKFYAEVPAPATIEALADMLEEKYDIDLPFVDLFRWGTPESNLKLITNAVDVGPCVIEDVACEQYAFRQDGLDWQIWMQQGDSPLPRKLVLTTLTDAARPEHTSTYEWNLAPAFDEDAFKFEPPKDAKKIPIQEVKAAREKEKEKKAGGPK